MNILRYRNSKVQIKFNHNTAKFINVIWIRKKQKLYTNMKI